MGRQKTLLGLMLLALTVLSLGQALALVEEPPAETAAVGLYSGRRVWAKGVVIRQELPLRAGGGPWRPLVADGERVAAGQALFAPAKASDPRPEIDQAARKGAALTLPRRRAAIHGAIAAEDPPALTGLLLAEGGGGVQTGAEMPESTIPAPLGGVFSASSDGLETVLTWREPWASYALPAGGAPALGRLITGDAWYFRTALPFSVAPGDTLEGRLPWYAEPLELTVAQLRDGGVLLRCDGAVEQVASARQIQMEISENSETGLEIPAQAVYTVEGTPGVWRSGGGGAEFCPIAVLRRENGRVIAAWDPSAEGALSPGDLVFLAPKSNDQ